MTSLEGTLLDFKSLDRLAAQETALHRLDPRAKLLVTAVFICTVVSFGKYELTALVPFFAFPLFMVAYGNLPARYIAKKVLLICPVVMMVGMFNPLFDRAVLAHLGPLGITGGWISFASIMLRTVLTATSALVLVGVTGFAAISRALVRLGIPREFAMQLLFLNRYIFVLAEEGSRASRARELRSFGTRGMGARAYGSLLGHLLLRTWQRAERIHGAMLARGFAGTLHTRQEFAFGGRELIFMTVWVALFITMRLVNATQLLGAVVMEMLR
jgi:cobalt/nickel transport system permease protein